MPSVWSYCDLRGVTWPDLEHLQIRPSSRSRYAISFVAKSTFKADQSSVDVKFTVVSLSKIDRCLSVKNRPLSVSKIDRCQSAKNRPLSFCKKSTVVSLLKIDRCQSVKNRPLSVRQKSTFVSLSKIEDTKQRLP